MFDADPGTAPPSIDIPLMRAIMQHGPEVAVQPDGGRTYTYTVSQDALAAFRQQMVQEEPQPTPDGLAACLQALATEARVLDLSDAALAIDLAVQLIGRGAAGSA